MPKVFIKKVVASGSAWPEIRSIFVKKTTGWTEVKNVFLKKVISGAASWVRVYTKASLPDTTTSPTIRTTNTSGTGTIYDGPVATSPKYLNDDLFGKDGVYTNFTSKFGRKFTRGSTSTALTRTTIVNDDRFTTAGGVTTAMRTACDEQYLYFELTVQNGSSANEIQSISSPIKMIKRAPLENSSGWVQEEKVGTELVFNYNLENYYYNSVEPDSSYIRWWRSTTYNAGGTLIQEETITATTTGTPSSTSRTGTSRYTPTSLDLGYYIVAEIIAVSSYTRHFGYTDNYFITSFPTDGPIGTALDFSDMQVRDYYGTDGSLVRNGLDNRDRWPVGTLNRYHWVLNGYIASTTTIRIRYRIYNFDTGRYYKPSTGAIQADTTAGASAAWDSYNSDGSGNGNISDITVSGTTATCYDFFDLDSSFFNGGGSGPTWWVEVELSAVRGGPRVYAEGYTGGYVSYYTGKAIDSSISASPSSAGLNADVTISGSLIGTPATPSTNGYPRQYKVTYGDGTNSGWLPVGEYANGTVNPTYSLTKQYSTAGTYTVSIDTIPHFEISSTTVTVTTTKLPPTMGTPTSSVVISGQRRLSVPFTAVTNSGPSYQIYWYPGADYAGQTKPPVSATIDGSGTTSPILDETGPTSIGRYAVWIRSSAANNTTGSTAPSTTLSDWSDLKYVYISGTRTLSYNKNTTDTVGSLPANSSGTDPWDGWVTNVSGNTPTRTGHTFNGYNTAADGTGTNYASSAAITLTSDVTLYAKWTADTYAVTYYGNSNTGGSVPDSQTKTYGVNLTLRTNTNTLTRTNYSFSGWNTNSSGNGTDYAAGATYSGNAALDLYAKWTSTAVAPDAPAAPTVGTLSYTHDSADLATTLTRVSNTAKTQAWTYTAEVGFPLTWVKPTGATDFEIYTNSTGAAPASSTSGNVSTSTGDVTTYPYWTTQSNRGTITRYFWVKAKNSTGSSGWSPASTAKTSVATVVSGLALLMYRGNGTGTPSSPSSPPASTALSYAWTGLANRGNPNGTPAGEGHYATVDNLTIAGTDDYATSNTA